MESILYSQQEVDYLKENYGKILAKDIAKKLERTSGSIRAKASILKIVSRLWNSKETRQKINEANTKKLDKSSYNPSQELSYIIGVLNGDGYLTNDTNYAIGLGTIDKSFALYFKKILKKWSKLNVCLYKEKDRFYSKGVLYRVLLNSKKVNKFLINFYVSQNKDKAIENIKKLLNYNKKFYTEFIKGFYDSEGCCYSNKRIIFANTNYHLILLIKKYLNFLDINTKIYKKSARKNIIRNKEILSKKIYNLNIQYQQGINKFFKIIKSSINRKNLIFSSH
jgi:intein-encoded DNA endonuclease-like protein